MGQLREKMDWRWIVITLVFYSTLIRSQDINHKLVKKYFIDLYNQALVKAMREQEKTDRKSNFQPYKNGQSLSKYKPFTPYNQPKPSSGAQNLEVHSPHSHWKGPPHPQHKHKHHTHYHQHSNEHKHAHKHDHKQKHEHNHEHNHHHKHKDDHDHGHDHKHSHKHLHSHKSNSWRRSGESSENLTRRNSNSGHDNIVPIEDEIKFDQDTFKTDDDDGVFTDYEHVEYDSWE